MSLLARNLAIAGDYNYMREYALIMHHLSLILFSSEDHITDELSISSTYRHTYDTGPHALYWKPHVALLLFSLDFWHIP